MANTVNYGTQTILFDYMNEASSLSFNKIFKEILLPGIYSGGLLSYNSGTISVAPVILLIETNNAEADHQLTVRVETAETVDLVYSAATPYVVGELEWVEIENNYMEIKCVDSTYVAAHPSVVIFGQIPPTFVPDYSERTIVSHKADTIELGDAVAINNQPTGGTASVFPGDSSVSSVLLDIYDRLIDLSGVTNEAVKKRHLELSNEADGLNGSVETVGAAIDLGGSAATIEATAKLSEALSALATALKNLSGVDAASVSAALLDVGAGANQVSGKTVPVGTLIEQALTGMSPVQIVALDGIDDSLVKILVPLATIASAVDALETIAQNHAASLATLDSTINTDVFTANFFPVGTILMFDGTDWEDNVTLAGWYACIAGNAAKGCPDLVDRFIKGDDPSGYPLERSLRMGGAGTITIAAANLPTHTHVINHTHGISISEAGSHVHGYIIAADRDRRTTVNASGGMWDGESNVNTSTAGLHTHIVTISEFAGSSGNGGFANTPITIDPVHYKMIFIRKCDPM